MPDVARAAAFMAHARQGVSYRPNTWHSGLTLFNKPARLTVLMWLDGTARDEEIVPVSPFCVREG